jgi:hypothetical protein
MLTHSSAKSFADLAVRDGLRNNGGKSGVSDYALHCNVEFVSRRGGMTGMGQYFACRVVAQRVSKTPDSCQPVALRHFSVSFDEKIIGAEPPVIAIYLSVVSVLLLVADRSDVDGAHCQSMSISVLSDRKSHESDDHRLARLRDLIPLATSRIC